MNRKNNIILTGGLRQGKSHVILSVIQDLEIDYRGLFSRPVIHNNACVGYGFQTSERSDIDLFAHVDFQTDITFDKYCVDLRVFDKAAHILKTWLSESHSLIVIDEIGVMEKSAVRFLKTIDQLLNSDIPCIVVVQERATYILQDLQNRRDCWIFQLHSPAVEHIVSGLKELVISLTTDRPAGVYSST